MEKGSCICNGKILHKWRDFHGFSMFDYRVTIQPLSVRLCCRSGMPFLRTYSVRVKKSLGLTSSSSSSSSKQSLADATSPSCDLEEACRLRRSFSSSSVCSWGCQPMLRKKLWSSEYCLGCCWISSIYSDFPGFVGKSSRSSRKAQNLKYTLIYPKVHSTSSILLH